MASPMRFSASGSTHFDHIALGMMPNIPPPSRRKPPARRTRHSNESCAPAMPTFSS